VTIAPEGPANGFCTNRPTPVVLSARRGIGRKLAATRRLKEVWGETEDGAILHAATDLRALEARGLIERAALATTPHVRQLRKHWGFQCGRRVTTRGRRAEKARDCGRMAPSGCGRLRREVGRRPMTLH
jgi:hypothetical protein